MKPTLAVRNNESPVSSHRPQSHPRSQWTQTGSRTPLRQILNETRIIIQKCAKNNYIHRNTFRIVFSDALTYAFNLPGLQHSIRTTANN